MYSWHEGEDKMIITQLSRATVSMLPLWRWENLWLKDVSPSQAYLHLASGVDLPPKPPLFFLNMIQVVQPPRASLFLFVRQDSGSHNGLIIGTKHNS